MSTDNTGRPETAESQRTEHRFVMASANPGKVREIEALIGSLVPGATVEPRPSWVGDVVEDADSLIGNARRKAVALCDATGLAAIADDTGLFVDALDGLPGVKSARYSGDHATDAQNVDKLLAELCRVGAVSVQSRTASFRTVAMIRFPDGSELVAEGRIDGHIAESPVGTSGFGYDPVFVPHLDGDGDGDGDGDADGLADGLDHERTFATMSAAAKNSVSHRSRAITGLVALLAERSSGQLGSPTL